MSDLDYDAAVDSVLRAPAAPKAPQSAPDLSYDGAVDTVLGAQSQRAQQNIVAATRMAPDQAAKVHTMAREAGLPAYAVEGNEALVFADLTARKNRDLMLKNPVLARAVANNSAFADIAFDDMQNAADVADAWEKSGFAGASRVARKVEDRRAEVLRAAPRGDATAVAPDYSLAAKAELLTKSARSGVEALKSATAGIASVVLGGVTEAELAALYKDDPEGLQRAREAPANFLNRIALREARKSSATMRDLPPGVQAGYGEMSYATLPSEKAAYMAPTKILADVVQSLPSTVALMVTSYFTRGAANKAEQQALAAGMAPEVARKAGVEAAIRAAQTVGGVGEGAQAFAQAKYAVQAQTEDMPVAAWDKSPLYNELRAAGYSDAAAKLATAAQAGQLAGAGGGMLTGAISVVGGRFLGKAIGEGGNVAARAGKGFLAEAGVEAPQSAGEQFFENVAKQQFLNKDQDLLEGVAEAALQGFFVGGASGALFSTMFGQAQADTDAANLNSLMDLVGKSAAKARDPVTFQSFMAGVTDNATVFINADALQETLAQNKIEASALPSLAEQLAQPSVTGDVEVPIGELMTAFAGTPAQEQIVQHARVRQDDLSAAEQAKFGDMAAFFKKQGEAVAERQKANEQFVSERQEIEAGIVEQLGKASPFGQREHRYYAQLMGAFYSTAAELMGTTPKQIQARWAPNILGVTDQAQPTSTLSQGFDHGNAMLNVGLDVGATDRAQQINAEFVKAEIEKLGVQVLSAEEVQGEYEYEGKPVKELTYVPHLSRPLTEAEVNALAIATGQEAIGQYYQGAGNLWGPNAANWGAFNPEFFKDQAGTKLSDAQKVLEQPSRGFKAVDINSPEFKRWARDAEIVQRDDTFDRDFADGEAVVVQLIHGTTGDFSSFERDRANPESDMGAGIYATNDELDASANYAGEGPDLTAKLEMLADQIQNEDEFTDDRIAAEAEARRRLSVRNLGFAMPVWMRFEKPFVLGGERETVLTYEQPYDEETDEYGTEAGTLVDFIVELRDVAGRYDDGSVESLVDSILEKGRDYGRISATDLFAAVREDEEFNYYTDDEGRLVSKDIFRQTLENLGYDGIIDQTVNEKFGDGRKRGQRMRGVNPQTKHFIAFVPTQIKSAISNTGEFSDENASILAQAVRSAGAVAGPVVGIHYSQQPRTSLASSAFGSGMPGAERERLAASKDPRIKQRVAFYVNTGSGITPESGVGSHAHVATLRNLYDADADALKIWRNSKGDMNAAESAVLDAGFDGYLTRNFGGTGAAVMLGSRNVDVASVKREDVNTTAEQPPSPEIPRMKQAAMAILQNTKLPFGQQSVESWRRDLERTDPDTASLIDWAAIPPGDYYKDQIAARLWQNDTWYYSALLRAVENAPAKVFGSGRAVAQWLTANAGKLAVKKEEIEATGITDWLETQGKVTKEQVVEFLQQGGVKVEEVVLGREFDPDNPTLPDGWKVRGIEDDERTDGPWEQYDYVVTNSDGLSRGFGNSEEDAINDAYGGYPRSFETNDDTKFASYQLPGGENYKELLLTLPEAAPVRKRSAFIAEMKSKYGAAEFGPDAWYNKATEGEKLAFDQIRDDARKSRAETSFVSSHFDQPNILAHVRTNMRTDANGKRVLFIEEIQSDWAQKGRKEGFAAAAKAEAVMDGSGWVAIDSEGLALTDERYETREAAIAAVPRASFGVPSAPFVTDTKAWTALALKRMIAYAVEQGADSIAWTTGEQQAARYDLSKQISSIDSSKTMQGAYAIRAKDLSGKTVVDDVYPEDKLEDVVGKELAKRIVEETPEGSVPGRAYAKSFTGLDLKVGGEGMKGYYDGIVPQVANDVLKKIGGGKVQMMNFYQKSGADYLLRSVKTGKLIENTRFTKEQADAADPAFYKAEYSPRELDTEVDPGEFGIQPGFAITPAMREAVGSGLPLFAEAAGPRRGSFNPLTFDLRLLADANRSTFIHEASHFFMAAYIDMASQPDAPPQLKEFVENLLGYLFEKVPGGAQAGGGGLGQKVLADLTETLFFPQTSEEKKQGYANRLKNPVTLKDGTRLSGFTDPIRQSTFLGYDKNGGPITIRREYVNPGDIVFSKDSNKTAEKLREGLRNAQQLAQEVGAGGTAYKAVDTNSPEFKKWFGDSKVVDAAGKPLRVFHGTAGDVRAFDPAKAGKNYPTTGGQKGFYFINTPGTAAVYAEQAALDGGENTMPVYLSLQNPVERKTSGSPDKYFDYNRDKILAAAEKAGADGVIVRGGGRTLYIAFLPEQIKSTISNTGAFQGPNILEQDGGPSTPGPIPEGRTNLERWQAMTLDQQRAYWEFFAEGFEQYAMTGKAPTKALQSAFNAFAKWMKEIYKTLKAFVTMHGTKPLDAELTQYFDRMLATDEELEAARAERGFQALFKNLAESGMSPAQFADYMALDDLQKTEAEELLRSRSIRDMKWLSNAKSKAIKELQAEADELRALVQASVEEELANTPIRQAERWLKKGEMKVGDDEIKAQAGHRLNMEIVKAMFPEGAIAGQIDFVKLGRGKNALASSTGTMHPDDMAALANEQFGGQFRNGEDLVRQLLDMPAFKDEVTYLTDLRMLEEHGDLATPEAIAKAADEAIHNDAHLRMVATEVWALGNRTGSVAALTKAAKAFAQNLVDNTVVKKLSPSSFANAATRAGKAAVRAVAKKDTDVAATEKRTEMVNAAAAKAAYAAEAEVRAIVTRLRKISAYSDKHSSVTTREMGVVQAVRAILAEFEIGQHGEKATKYLKTLNEYDPTLGAVLDSTIESLAPEAKPWQNLKVTELRELHAAVTGLWRVAKDVRSVELAGEKMSLDDARAQLIAKLEERSKAGRDSKAFSLTDAEIRNQDFQSYTAKAVRPESWISMQDGLDEYGPWRRLIWNSIDRAQLDYNAEKAEKLKALKALLVPVMSDMTDVQIDAPELGGTFGAGSVIGYSELLHAILHTGNLSNKTKLLVGRGWGSLREDGSLDSSKWDSFLKRMYAEGKIAKTHMDFVQGVWDLLESMKEGAQKAHRATTGRYFEEIEPSEIVTPFGVYRGGYAPAIVDRRQVADMDLRKLQEAAEMDVVHSFEKPAGGFTKSRAQNYNQKLELNIAALGRHIDQVLLFSHMSVPVRNVQRVLKGKDLSSALAEQDRAALGNILAPWLHSASTQTVTEKGKLSYENMPMFTKMRSRAGAALMFANVSNSVQQLTGFFPAALKVSKKELLFAAAKGWYKPRELAASVAEMSPYMKQRIDNEVHAMAEEIDQILLNPTKFERAQDWAIAHSYFLQTAVDSAMSPIIWQAKFNEATARGAAKQEAIDLADSAVRMTQGSNRAIDIAAMEKGSPFYRMFMQFAGYFNTQVNLVGEKLAREKLMADTPAKYGRIGMVLTLGWLAPAIASALVVQLFRGGVDDDDKDGEWLDDWLISTFLAAPAKYVTAAIPVFGQAINAALNAFNDKPYDDRISMSPAVSIVEAGVRGGKAVIGALEDPTKAGRAIRDVGSLVALFTGVPITPATKAIGYATDVETGKVAPTGPVDYGRGIITGTASPESKR